jgi:hypothetical protein
VYESMFGNTDKVAQAISDVREAHPDAHVECVAVGRASPELIKSTDLLIVGGPTHLRHMTTNFSRKRQISREKKAEANGEPPHELELDMAGQGLRAWFYQLPKAKEGGVLAGPHRHAAAFDTRLGSALAGGAGYGIAHKLQGHGNGLVKNPEGFILDDAFGPLAQARSSARRSGELSWCRRASAKTTAGRSAAAGRASSPTCGGSGGRR